MKLPRSYGSRIYVAHLAVVVLGLVVMLSGFWRSGIGLVGVSFALAALARAWVSEDHTGMLRVRGRTFDIIWMGFLGFALCTLAIIVPGK